MFAKTAAVSVLLSLGISAIPSAAQALTCVRVRDPDGWVNVRDRYTGEVVGQFDNNTYFVYNGQTADGYAILVSSPSLIVHASRLEISPGRFCTVFWTVRDPDGWSNVRSSPGGSVVGTVNSGERVLRIGGSGEWAEVVTPNGTFGYIHTSRLRGMQRW